MSASFSSALVEQRRQELRRQADQWRLLRHPKPPRPEWWRGWRLQSPLIRRPLPTPWP